MTIYDAFLSAARLASSKGSFSVACELYEQALSWKDGDPLLDLKSKYGAKVIDFLQSGLPGWTSTGKKIEAIKQTRENSDLGLKDSKELVELMATRMQLEWKQ